MKRLLFVLIPIIVVALCGCASASPIDLITPTIVPPLAKQLGYDIPDIKGVTTVGIVKGFLEVEKLRLMALDSSASLTLKATQTAVDGLLGLLATVGLVGAGVGVPVALRRLPKGAVNRDDYEKAGKMQPEEFNSKAG